MKQLTIKMDDDLHRALKIYCAQKRIEMSELIRKMIEKLLKEKGTK